ncbi:unnamed protein product [Tetraodon nigroviridis]|uniref:(spotted green pufferfish) hypothetical protein n=1 Tax=Tetraodon nigroviridis TaxID=99883 RepID=Q4SGT0_TETNG|nr:unnamed protein product [Tetraodon nigroviridis]
MATFDDVLEEAGAFGRCQKRIFALLSVLPLTSAGFFAGIVFQGYTPDHWCRDSAVVDMRRACGWSLEHTRSLTVPLSNTSGRLQPSKCTRFDVDWNTTTLGCDTETLNLTGVPLSACKKRIFALLSVLPLTSAGFFAGIVFQGYTPDHLCRDSAVVDMRRACGWSLEHTRSLTVPLSNTSGRLQPSKCTRFDVDWNTTTLGCDTETLNLTGVPLSACKEGWEFDYEGRRTFVTEVRGEGHQLVVPLAEKRFEPLLLSQFNLVCSDSWLVDMFQSIFGVGRLVGSLTVGYFSDMYGRKVSIIMSTLLNCMAGISMAVAPSYICILILRAIVGFVTEIVGVEQRRFVGIFYQMFISISFLIIPLLAYFITDWRWLQAAFCLPSIIFVCYYWFIPESPRWLVSQKKFSKAYEITNAMATENKRNISKNLEALAEDEGDSPSASVLDLLRTPNMRKYTLILMFNWFTSEVVYQGLIMRVGITAKNLYIDFLISALVEIPAALLILFTIERMGRRLPFASSNFIAGLSCLITAFIPDRVISLMGGALVLLLPETKGVPLPDTIDDVEFPDR